MAASTPQQRIREINERLKVICPENDLDQYNKMCKDLENKIYDEVFGCDKKTAGQKFFRLSAEMSQARLDLVTKMSDGVVLSPPGNIQPDDPRSHERLSSFYSRQLERTLNESRSQLAAIDSKKELLASEYSHGHCAVADELWERLGRPTPQAHDVSEYGAAEHQKEVADLKEERRRLVADYAERCQQCGAVLHIDITGEIVGMEQHVHGLSVVCPPK